MQREGPGLAWAFSVCSSSSHRATAPRVAAGKARRTNGKVAPKVAVGDARDTAAKPAPKVVAEKASNAQFEEFRYPQVPGSMRALAERERGSYARAL